MGKTKILANSFAHSATTSGHLKIKGKQIEILPTNGSTMYLGRLLCMSSLHDTEIDHRIDKAWKAFWSLKRELCNKSYRLHVRLKLFEAVVTPTLLYSSGTWNMTVDRERKLQSTQRRMLRSIVQVSRRRFDRIPTESSTSSNSGSDDGSSSSSNDRQETW